jgi:hypothetical protein
MFDRHDVTHHYVTKDRIEQSLRKAARERIWEQESQTSFSRMTIARIGTALVMIGTRLQTIEQGQQVRRLT